MTFQEEYLKNNNLYSYKVEDVFGVIGFSSENRLNGEILDDLVSLVLKYKINSGEVKTEKGIINYNFKKAPMWRKKEICENTHISTKEVVKEFTLIDRLKTKISNWHKKLVGVFRLVLKKI